MFATKVSALFLITFILSGCNASLLALQQPTADAAAEKARSESDFIYDMQYLAAVDLVNTLVQVPRLHPANASVLQMKKPTPGFGQNVYEVMKIAGYNIQIVDAANVQDPRVTYLMTPGSVKSTFQINIETFKARRTYSVLDNEVKPESSIYIFGADPDTIKTNDHIFEKYKSA